jgi:hypothetical protein
MVHAIKIVVIPADPRICFFLSLFCENFAGATFEENSKHHMFIFKQ